MIIIVFGLPGSGKSYFASKLAERINARYVNSDVIRRELFDVRKYSREEKMTVYNVMFREMKKAILQNKSIVLDATFYKRHIRNKFIEVVNEIGKRIIFIEIRAELKIIIERLSRKRKNSEADYSVYLQIKEVFEPMEEEHLILRSTQENIDKMLNMAINHMNKSHG